MNTSAILLTLILSAAPNSYPLRVERVVDGDTIVADIDLGFGVKLYDAMIRMADYDTWETGARGGQIITPEEKTKGKAAKADLEKLLAASKRITIVPDAKPRDNFGRVLGRVYVDDKSLGDVMKIRGHIR